VCALTGESDVQAFVNVAPQEKKEFGNCHDYRSWHDRRRLFAKALKGASLATLYAC